MKRVVLLVLLSLMLIPMESRAEDMKNGYAQALVGITLPKTNTRLGFGVRAAKQFMDRIDFGVGAAYSTKSSLALLQVVALANYHMNGEIHEFDKNFHIGPRVGLMRQSISGTSASSIAAGGGLGYDHKINDMFTVGGELDLMYAFGTNNYSVFNAFAAIKAFLF